MLSIWAIYGAHLQNLDCKLPAGFSNVLSNEQAFMLAYQSDRLNWSLIPTNPKLKYTCVLQPFAVGSIWLFGRMDRRSRSRSPTGLEERVAALQLDEELHQQHMEAMLAIEAIDKPVEKEEMEEGAKEEGWREDCGKEGAQWWWSHDTWWVQWQEDWWAWNWVNAEWLSWSVWTRYY